MQLYLTRYLVSFFLPSVLYYQRSGSGPSNLFALPPIGSTLTNFLLISCLRSSAFFELDRRGDKNVCLFLTNSKDDGDENDLNLRCFFLYSFSVHSTQITWKNSLFFLRDLVLFYDDSLTLESRQGEMGTLGVDMGGKAMGRMVFIDSYIKEGEEESAFCLLFSRFPAVRRMK